MGETRFQAGQIGLTQDLNTIHSPIFIVHSPIYIYKDNSNTGVFAMKRALLPCDYLT